MRFILLIFAMFNMIACANNLIGDIPPDDDVYTYGLGISISYSDAKDLALSDISKKISSSVGATVIISQKEDDGNFSTTMQADTSVKSLSIVLPNVKVIKSIENNGEWWILVRVEVSGIQRSIKNQIDDMSDDFEITIEDYSDSPGPACWFALKGKEKVERFKFNNLISAYISLGKDDPKKRYQKGQIRKVKEIFERCKKRNRYRLQVENDSTGEFERSLQENLSASDIKLTRSSKNTGVIEAKLELQYKAAFNQEIIYLSVKLKVKDEFGNFIKETKIKTKGVSFSSRKEAEKKAIESLIKKVRKLSFTI